MARAEREASGRGLWRSLRSYGALLAALGLVAISAALILTLPTRSPFEAAPLTPTATPSPTATVTPRPPLPTPNVQTLADLAQMPILAQGGALLTRELEPFTVFPVRPRHEVITYTVQSGDTLWSIAEKFNIKMDSLFWANRVALPDVHMVHVGLELNILPVDGVYHTANGEETIKEIADRFSADPYVIIDSSFNDLSDLTPEDQPEQGTRIVIAGGTDDYADWVWRPPAIRVASATGPRINFAPDHPGSCGPVPLGQGGDGTFSKPLRHYFVGWTFHEWHRAIDLMAWEGSPVYAADPGMVIFAGWNTWGYGNLIVLSHGNGWTTYYSHLSYLNVGCGQYVNAGQQIGEVGSTGRSTGPHLHFEIRLNGEPLDPQGFIVF